MSKGKWICAKAEVREKFNSFVLLRLVLWEGTIVSGLAAYSGMVVRHASLGSEVHLAQRMR